MTTISEAITRDHREIKDYYNEVVGSSDVAHQTSYGNLLVWELARHSVGEELILYPAFEQYMGEKGKEMADKDREQHHEVKILLKKFQALTPRDEDYRETLDQLMGPLREHMEEEERDDLPAIEEALKSNLEDQNGSAAPDPSSLSSTVVDSQTLARRFALTKKFVPTRSHPSAGEHPLFESAMGLLAAPIDHLMDLMRKFPDQPSVGERAGQTSERADSPIEATKETARKGVERTQSMGQSAMEGAKDTAEAGRKKTRQAADTAGDKARDVSARARDTARRGSESVKRAVSSSASSGAS